MSSMYLKELTVEKPSGNIPCLGSAVPACWAQEKFPDKSGKYVSPFRLLALTEADAVEVHLMVAEYEKNTKALFRIPCVAGPPPVALAGDERSKTIRREKREQNT